MLQKQLKNPEAMIQALNPFYARRADADRDMIPAAKIGHIGLYRVKKH